MAYKFVDTIEAPGAEEMPAEAMKINGEYIENLMDSRYCTYRTLYTEGRETLSPETSSFSTGVRDGSSLLSKRYPERVITVGYKLQAISDYWFRIAYNELMKILDVEDAELIFYDEQDKYFIGTPTGMKDGDSGTNFVQGEITITCHDPFKYSVKEYEVEPEDDGTFVIDYNGTYKGYPELEADFYEQSECGDDGETPTQLTASGDCGYVAWFMPGEEEEDDARIVQLGDPDEEDIEEYAKSQTLVSQNWRQVSSWTEALNNLWAKNSGVLPSGFKAQTGTAGFPMANSTEHYLGASSYGSSDEGDHGPSVTRTFPADDSGVVGATDWTASCQLKLCIANGSSGSSCMGSAYMIIHTDDGKIVAGFSVYKHSSGTSGSLRAYVNHTVVKTIDIDLSYRNTHFGHNSADGKYKSVKNCTITKSGDTVTMNLGGTSWSFTDANIKNMVATKLTLAVGQYKSKTPFYYHGFFQVKFTKNNCATWADIPNKFTLNDTAVADCTDGEVYINDAPEPGYGALGNDWERFYLKPGYNQIGFSYSDWCDLAPTTKIRYREVYL